MTTYITLGEVLQNRLRSLTDGRWMSYFQYTPTNFDVGYNNNSNSFLVLGIHGYESDKIAGKFTTELIYKLFICEQNVVLQNDFGDSCKENETSESHLYLCILFTMKHRFQLPLYNVQSGFIIVSPEVETITITTNCTFYGKIAYEKITTPSPNTNKIILNISLVAVKASILQVQRFRNSA